MDLFSVLLCVVDNKNGKYALKNFKEEFKEKLVNEDEKFTFELLKNICSMTSNFNKDDSVFEPSIILDEKRSFAMEDITERDIEILLHLDLDKLPLVIRARVADVLWIVARHHVSATVAAKAYKELFKISFDVDQWVYCVNMIKRAITISAQLGKKQYLYQECCQCAYDYLITVNGTDKLFFSVEVIEILLKQHYGDIDEYLNIIEKIINNDSSNLRKLERVYNLRAQILNRKNDKAEVRKNWLDWARHLEDNAEQNVDIDFRGLFIAENSLKKAVYVYRNNGMPEEGERVHKRLVEIQKKFPQVLNPVKAKIDVSDAYKMVMESMDGLSFQESIIRLSQFTRFYTKEELCKSILDGQGTSMFKSLFGINMLNRHGQTIANIPPLDIEAPEKNVEVFEKHMHYKAFEYANIEGNTYLKWCLDIIRNTFEFERSNLEFLVKGNPIIPEGRENIFLSAIYMGVSGEIYEALHILAPQVENLFRNIANAVGGLTVTLENDGSSKEKVLSSIFDLPELVDCYDNDILFVFKGMLNEQTGANIRNNIAHGIMDEGMGNSGSSIYFFCATIKLLLFTSLNAVGLMKGNEKLSNCIPEE